jgi:hypothetical protein
MATKTAKKIDPALKVYIAEAIQEALNDPDFGLELTDYAKKRLRAAMKDKRPGKSLARILAKYR